MKRMNSHTAGIVWRRAFILGALALAALMLHPGLLPAQTNACALLNAGDVAALLGGTPTSKATPQGQACTPVKPFKNVTVGPIILPFKNLTQAERS